jgi:hypothetical protein
MRDEFSMLWGEGEWIVGRDGGYDLDGEWVLGQSWAASRVLRSSYALELAVQVKVHIWGKRGRKRRLRPFGWAAHLELHPAMVEVGRAGCKSVADALRQVDRLDLTALCNAVTRQAYIQQRKCVFRLEPGSNPRWVGSWVPWLTTFSMLAEHKSWPDGSYFIVAWQHNFQAKCVLRGYAYCISMGGSSSGTWSFPLPAAPSQWEHLRHQELGVPYMTKYDRDRVYHDKLVAGLPHWLSPPNPC